MTREPGRCPHADIGAGSSRFGHPDVTGEQTVHGTQTKRQQHLRTTNPIESTFATVRHRTTRTRYCVSRSTFLGLAFKPVQEVEKSWWRIRGTGRIADLLKGTVFADGIPAPEFTLEQPRLAA